MTDYRTFRLSKLNTDEFKHLKLLLYWPIYGILFWFVERFYPVDSYFAVYHPLDDLIPFCEYFLIPYIFWFVFMAGMLFYLLLMDVEGFRKMMWFIILTYSITIIIYLLFPTCQNLRPAEFERDNFFTYIMGLYYRMDTNTNVCPSIHVIGSLAVVFAAFHTPRFSTVGWKWAFAITGGFICLSTVMLKQHSVLDVFAGLLLSFLIYPFIYTPLFRKRKKL